jgi:hypothetical protein
MVPVGSSCQIDRIIIGPAEKLVHMTMKIAPFQLDDPWIMPMKIVPFQ